MLIPMHFASAAAILASLSTVAAGSRPVPLGASSPPLLGNFVEVTAYPAAGGWPGITFMYDQSVPMMHAMMGGVAVADFDDDGWLDVFFPNDVGSPNSLYRNLGNGTFVEEAALRGVDDPSTAGGTGLFSDYDDDGDLDLFVMGHAGYYNSYTGALFKLFRNAGAAGGYVFHDVTSQAGFALAPTNKGTLSGANGGAAIGDYDRDGHPDLFATWWQGTNGQDMWRLMRSDPNPVPGDPNDPTYTPRVYTDQTVGAGLDFNFLGGAWQPVWIDPNRDGFLDLHVNIDFNLDYFFLNNQDGTFTEMATAVGLNGDPPQGHNEMGCGLGDPDNDGDVDLHLTNMMDMDRFYRNDSTHDQIAFVDIAPQTGTQNSMWGWGDVFFEFDNDGDLDHATVTGWQIPWKHAWNWTFHQNLFPQELPDGNVAWSEESANVPELTKIGMGAAWPYGHSGRGLAAFDYDADGDLDLVASREAETAGLFQNTLSAPHHWLAVDLREQGGSLDVTGAKIWLRSSGVTQMRYVVTGSSFLSQEPLRQHFGLGASGAKPRFVTVQWADGTYTIVDDELVVDAVNGIQRGSNDAGDMNGDGKLSIGDLSMLQLLVANPAAYALAYPDAPGSIVGDVDANGVIDARDLQAWPLVKKSL